MDKKLKKVLMSSVLSVAFIISSVDTVLAASNADTLYANAYNSVIACQSGYTQQSINGARNAIKNLKGTGASWAIGEFSKQVDGVQQKLFEEFMGYLFDSNHKPRISVPQQDINRARDLVNSFATYEGNAPYVRSWSSAVDEYQNIIIREVVSLLNKAEETNKNEDVAAARKGVSILLTANNNSSVINFANALKEKLASLASPILIEELSLNTTIAAPDSSGTRYLQATYTNNSSYNIIGFAATILLKDTNEKTYLSSYDTVLKGEISPNFETFAPNTGSKSDMEYLKYEITAVDDEGNVIYLDYDVKLNKYVQMPDKIENIENPMIKINQVPIQINILKPDSIGTRYMEATYTNNSGYTIQGMNITVLLKDSNEKTYFSTYDTVLKGGISTKFETFAPNSGSMNDLEILKYDIVAIKEDGTKVYIEYDVKLGVYKELYR
ncbi:hypothetical protein [Clostridium sp.]|uniref:hypothetical protein n=1 Tax=Clostridium sp. TaxID=1506 RepID=UPI002FC87430